MFKVGERVIQTAFVQPNEKRAAIITKIEGDTIWHKHIGSTYQGGNEIYQEFGSTSSKDSFRKVRDKKNG